MLADHLERAICAVLEHEGVVDDTLGHARHHGHRAGIAARVHRPPEDDVAPAVDVVREVGDLVAVGHGPCDPDRRLHGLAAGRREGEPVVAGHRACHLGDRAQQVALDADRESAVELRLDGRHDEVRRVPEQIGAEPEGGVDVLVAVNVPDPRAARALGHDLVDELLPGLVEPDDRAVVGEPRPPQLGEPLRPRCPGVVAADEVVDGGLLALGHGAALATRAMALAAGREVVGLRGRRRRRLGRGARSRRTLRTRAGGRPSGRRLARPHQRELLLHDPQLLPDEPFDRRAGALGPGPGSRPLPPRRPGRPRPPASRVPARAARRAQASSR